MAKKFYKKLYVTGEINSEAFNTFSVELTEFEQLCLNKKVEGHVQLEICSDGGDAYAALAYYDRITASPVQIHGIILGIAASAASLIFMACTTRDMGRSAWLMVHEDSTSDLSGKVSELEKEINHSRRLENQWAQLFVSVSDIPLDQWIRLHKAETYLNREDCSYLGILGARK